MLEEANVWRNGTYVEQIVEMKDRADPAIPVAVPISRWSAMMMVATVEFRISFQPMKAAARKTKMAARTGVSGVEDAIAIALVSTA